MATDIGSIQPNPYLFKIDSQRSRRAKLAHEVGAGASCKKCREQCKGFELHYWRKICLNCRCSKDDHEIAEDEEDIGRIVIGKLFNRPIRTLEEEESYSHGTNLEIVDTTTGKKEEMVFDWVPPGVAKNLATKYMEMLPPEKRPVTGTQAARDRRKQLEQQLPLYDMDENERCENMPQQEYENFQKYMTNIKSEALGQASIQEIIPHADLKPFTHHVQKPPRLPCNAKLVEPFSNISLQDKTHLPDNQQPIHDSNSNVFEPSHTHYVQPVPGPMSQIQKSQPYRHPSQSTSYPTPLLSSNTSSPKKYFVPSNLKQGSSPSTVTSPFDTPCLSVHKNIVPAASGFYAAESNANIMLPQESQILRKPKSASHEEFHCEQCKLPMTPGDVAVLCDKAGSNKFWHPNCFVCTTCNELLADLIYFYKEGKIYCGRHFHEASNVPRCHACDELIFSDSWTRADQCDWHLHHYCCFVCDKPLAGHKYVADDRSHPHCIPCYMAFMAKMCETCELKISPEEARAGYHGYFFHAVPGCFCCYGCRKSLLGIRFKMVKNWVFCSQDCVNNCSEEIAKNPNEKEKSI